MIKMSKRQICTQCSWKNPIIERSDCLIAHHKECPKCGGELVFKDVGQLEDSLDFFMRILKN